MRRVQSIRSDIGQTNMTNRLIPTIIQFLRAVPWRVFVLFCSESLQSQVVLDAVMRSPLPD